MKYYFYSKYSDDSVNFTAKTTRRILVLIIMNVKTPLDWYNLEEKYLIRFLFCIFENVSISYNQTTV